MVRAAIALAVFALGAVSTVAQSIDNEVDFETRDLIAEVEAREYVEEVDARELLEEYARELLEEYADVDARDNDVFGDLDAREVEEVFEYLRDVSSSSTATTTPTKTVTVTHTKQAKATGCSKKELKTLKHNNKVSKARKTLIAAKSKKPKSLKEKLRVKAAKKVLKKHLKKKAHAKRLSTKKAKKAARKARKQAALKAAASSSAPTATGTATSTASPSKITPAPKTKTKKSLFQKLFKKGSKKSKANKKVGKDGVATVHTTITAAAPSCSAPSSLRKLLKTREFDDELTSVFERESEFDELD